MLQSSGEQRTRGAPLANDERARLIREHVIHEFDEALILANMRGCYGAIMGRFYDRLLQHVVGHRILDVGCGFGGFGSRCAAAGLQAHSIDIDDESLRIARMLYRHPYHHESVYGTSLPDDSIDTVVINDAVAHLDLPPLLREVRRLGARRVVIHDSNILNPLLRGYRQVTGHKERHDYTARALVAALAAQRLRCTSCAHVNFLSLPISGGLQRRPLPVLSWFPGLIDAVDGALAWVLGLAHVDQWLAFRFVAVFDVLAD
jgi:SAM-dependent methyltransferase